MAATARAVAAAVPVLALAEFCRRVLQKRKAAWFKKQVI
jgi:hypothetical protein